METAHAHAICDALVSQARQSLAETRREAAARPIGEMRLDVDLASKADRDKPAQDYDFHAHGRHYKGFGARWAVWLVRWTGDEWRRVRRIGGPQQHEDALTLLGEECRRRDLKRVGR